VNDAHLSDDDSILLGNKVPGARVKQSLQRVEPWGTVDDEGDHTFLLTVSGEIFYPVVIGISGRADDGAHDVSWVIRQDFISGVASDGWLCWMWV